MAEQSEPASEEAAETTDIPSSLADGPVQPGDTITLTVVSADESSGMITVTKSSPAEESTETEGGSEAMASEFDNTQPTT
jgi:hypothetical protein